MTTNALPVQYQDVVAEMRRWASAGDPLAEVAALSQRLAHERRMFQRRIFEVIAPTATENLAATVKDAHARAQATRAELHRTMTQIEARALTQAKADLDALRRVRSEHRSHFGDHISTHPTRAQLKFRNPVSWSGLARPGECFTNFAGDGWFAPDLPTYEASAEMSVDEQGAWLHPYLYVDDADCDGTRRGGYTRHELIYRMAAPSQAFSVDSVRVDLVGSGISTAIPGPMVSPWGALGSGFTIGRWTLVSIVVNLAQRVGDSWAIWPLVSDTPFRALGEHAEQVRLVLPGQTYPTNFRLRSPTGNGGELVCFVQLTCRTDGSGFHSGRARLSFAAPDLGIFVGGVALIGGYDQLAVEQ